MKTTIAIFACLLAVGAAGDAHDMKAQWNALDKPACAEGDENCKTYKYEGEKFKLTFDPETYSVKVEGLDQEATISVNEQYRTISVRGTYGGSSADDFMSALQSACDAMVIWNKRLAERPSVEEIQKEIAEGMEKLP